MDATGPKDARQVGKNLLIIFFLWVAVNHSIKFLTPQVSPQGGLINYVTSVTLKSLDRFRLGTGIFIGKAQRYCPGGAQEGCKQVLDTVRGVMGLN